MICPVCLRDIRQRPDGSLYKHKAPYVRLRWWETLRRLWCAGSGLVLVWLFFAAVAHAQVPDSLLRLDVTYAVSDTAAVVLYRIAGRSRDVETLVVRLRRDTTLVVRLEGYEVIDRLGAPHRLIIRRKEDP